MLKIVVPKGSLEASTFQLFEEADLKIRRSGSRDYRASIEDPRVSSVAVLRPQEIPLYVEDGIFDLGITGEDWIAEQGSKVAKITPLNYSKQTARPVRIVLAVSSGVGISRPEQIEKGSRISTEFPNLTRAYFKRLGIDVTIFLSYGATEAKVPEIVDAIVDLTETGSTLRHHGMEIVDVLLESRTYLIANPSAYANAIQRRAIEELTILLQGTIEARRHVLVKLNIHEDRLEELIRSLPAMRAPTISRLTQQGFVALETIVPKSEINILIPRLKALEAEDVLELPVTKIIP